jgi:hypothetical protein
LYTFDVSISPGHAKTDRLALWWRLKVMTVATSDNLPALTPSKRLFMGALAAITQALNLKEIHSVDGGPWRDLPSHAPFHQGSCGEVRLFSGDKIAKVLTCSITAPVIGLDSHMLFAFTPSESAVPHFTVDSVQAGDHLAFHLDLIPRLDLATHLAYMDWAFGGLTETFEAAKTIEGLSPAMITPRQRAVMSPWMIVNRATPEAFDQVEPLVQTYLQHWLASLESGAPSAALGATTQQMLSERDSANRAIIFDPDVDKVWNQISGLIGGDAVAAIRGELMSTQSAKG